MHSNAAHLRTLTRPLTRVLKREQSPLTRLLSTGAIIALASSTASAHGFGRTYSLPVPFWLYSYAAIATLLLTFAIAALFLRSPTSKSAVSTPLHKGEWQADDRLSPPAPIRRAAREWRGLPVISLLALTIVCGLTGVRNPFANLSMTLFWVVFVLIVPYSSAILGDLNARCNPFHALLRLTAACLPLWRNGLLKYPKWLGVWPALLLYMAFISIELFGHQHPAGLSCLLLMYTGITLFGGLLFGAQYWLAQGECFSVLIRLLALMAPRIWRDSESRWHYQLPFSGLLKSHCTDLSELIFLLFLLTATSFDGLHESAPWVRLFWTDLLLLIGPLLTPPLLSHYNDLLSAYGLWQQFWLLAFPFIYGLLYLGCMLCMRYLTRTSLSLRSLGLRFALTLLPIILVYHVSHYLSLLVTQGTQLLPLLSDPLGWGWNLFGTANWVTPAIELAPITLWHTQVVLIVLGHGISVWLAHAEALSLFPSPRLAMRSQWPLLFLMLLLTIAGLWILAQPFSPPETMQLLTG